MHSDSGFKVLEMAQLVDEFKKVARYDDQDIKIVGIDGTVHFGDLERLEETAGERPEVDRVQLRQLFLDSLKPGTVKWVSPCVSMNTSDFLTDGTMAFPRLSRMATTKLQSTSSNLPSSLPSMILLSVQTAHGLAFDPLFLPPLQSTRESPTSIFS